jgi:hypothetical protein
MRVCDGKLSCSRAASSLHRPVYVVKSPSSFRPGAALVHALALLRSPGRMHGRETRPAAPR